MPDRRTYVATITKEASAAASAVVEIVEPRNTPIVGLLNAQDSESTVYAYQPYFRSSDPAEIARFSAQGVNTPRTAWAVGDLVSERPWFPANQYPDFSRWPTPALPRRWQSTTSHDADNGVAKTTTSGPPTACRFFSSGGDVGIAYQNFLSFDVNCRFTVTVSTPSASTPIYATAGGVDLNGGLPINAEAGTITGEYLLAGEAVPFFELIARPGAAGEAVVDFCQIEWQYATGISVDSLRPRIDYTVGPDVVSRPDVVSAREASRDYLPGDRVTFSDIFAQCIVGGQSASTPPQAWRPATSTTVVDGGVTWQVLGRYSPVSFLCQPDIVDEFGVGNFVSTLAGGWDAPASSGIGGIDSELRESVFDFDEPRAYRLSVGNGDDPEIRIEITSATADVDALAPASMPAWHTMMLIIEWTDETRPTADRVDVAVSVDGVEMLNVGIVNLGAAPVIGPVAAAVAEVEQAGEPMMLGPGTWAYWISWRYADGRWPAGASSTTLAYYIAGRLGNNYTLGTTPQCVQVALGVRGRFWPATMPLDVGPCLFPADALQVDLSYPGRSSNAPVDMSCGTAVVIAEPLQSERYRSPAPGPAAAESLVGFAPSSALDSAAGFSVDGLPQAIEGLYGQYKSTSLPDPAGDFSTPSIIVVQWDSASNFLEVRYLHADRKTATQNTSNIFYVASPAGFSGFSGSGDIIEIAPAISRAFQVSHAAVFSRLLTAEELGGLQL